MMGGYLSHFLASVLHVDLDNKAILASGRRLKGESEMAVALSSPELKRGRNMRGRTIRLVRAVVDRSATTPTPEAPAKEIAKMEFPYDDLYLMYSYITKELGIKDHVDE